MSDYGLIIAGEKRAIEAGFDINDPATGALVGRCPNARQVDLDAAVAAARQAFPGWRATATEARAQACNRIADAIESHAAELARLLTREQGKPLGGTGSEFELGGCVAWTRYAASIDLPVEVLEDNEQQRVEQHRKPLGVVASITPWNWPLMIAIWHIIPAIRTGNTVVIKPSPYTPLSTLRLIEIINAELPPGVINAIAGEDPLGAAISEHPGIDKIVFTGSTATGKKVMAGSAATLKRLTLELGGNDAAIVLPDVDPAAIAEKIFWSAFINSGQTCAALKRLYVHDAVYEPLCAALTEVAEKTPLGNGLEPGVLLGPLQNAMQFEKVKALVADARARGARILCGGDPLPGDGYFYPPTLVADIGAGARLVDEEQFGTALPIIRYSDIEQAIESANACEQGLGGSIWSADIAAARALAPRLECGTVWINSHAGVQPNVPFGGVKASGFGVEFGIAGMQAYTSIQIVTVDKQ